MLKKLFKKLFGHKCCFETPIVSQYRTFSTRRIIYQCACGKREATEVHREFGKAFPIPTALLLSSMEFNKILAGGDVPPDLIVEESKIPKVIFGKTD